MNEGRIWLYVSPTVGIPLFFLAFIFASLAVHASILNNTTWMAAFWQGKAEVSAPAVVAAPAAVVVAPVEAAPATN